MPRPGPNVTSDADTQPGSDSLFPTGFSGGGALVRSGSVGTGELADGSVASADLNLSSVATALAARGEFTGTYASKRTTFYGDAASQADGTPATLTSGQAVTVFGNAPTTVTSGKYIHTPFAGANSAGYIQVDTIGNVGQAGGSFYVPTGSITRPSLVIPLAPWANGSLTPAGLHFVFNPVTGDWHCDRWNGTAVETYATGNCGVCLDAEFDLDVQIDKAAGTATLFLPNGRAVKVASPYITSETSHYVVWELYELDGTGATSGWWTRLRAHPAETVDRRPWRADIAASASQPTVVSGTHTADVLAPTTLTQTHTSHSITFTAPPGGKVLMRATGNVSLSAAAKVNWQMYGGAGAPGGIEQTVARSDLTAGDTTFAGVVSPQWLVTGLTPGASYTYVLRHKSSTASTAILKNGDASGYPVTLVVQPAI